MIRTTFKACTRFLATLVLASGAMSAQAGVIELSSIAGGIQVNYAELIGQSFTAIDSEVEAGLHLSDFNSSHPNDTLRYHLFEGNGATGTSLATFDFDLTPGHYGFFMADFSDVTLTVGSIYSLVVEMTTNSPRWGIASVSDNYAGGNAIFQNNPSNSDYAIRVVGVSVPAPFTFGLLIVGLLGLARSRQVSAA